MRAGVQKNVAFKRSGNARALRASRASEFGYAAVRPSAGHATHGVSASIERSKDAQFVGGAKHLALSATFCVC